MTIETYLNFMSVAYITDCATSSVTVLLTVCLTCRKIFEKYDCQVVGKPGGGGEYDVQVCTFVGNT
jgi:hypothetical protein